MTELDQILATSSAADAFKADVRNYCAGAGVDRIRIDGYAPRVKVRRLVTHILATESQLPIEHITLRAQSGCSDFSGTVTVHTTSGAQAYEFVWDCRWRAEQEGWTDYFGFPDQIRAAQEYDWRCFEQWTPLSAPTASSIL